MGASSSRTRKLTVENDDPTSVIKVSEDVVDRIRGKQSVSQTNSQEAGWPAAGVPQQGFPVPAGPFYIQEPSLTTIQLRQANVAELKKNDEYWKERMKNLEKSQKQINEVMDKEYKKALEEFDTSGRKAKIEIPCQDSKRAVMECYRKHPNEPMLCAKIVQDFQDCVDMKRNVIIASSG